MIRITVQIDDQPEQVYEVEEYILFARAGKSLHFMRECMDDFTLYVLKIYKFLLEQRYSFDSIEGNTCENPGEGIEIGKAGV